MAKSRLVCRCGISVVVGEEAGTDDLSSVMFHGRSIPDAPTPRPPLSDDRACTATNPHYRALSTLSVDNAQLGFSLFWDWCGCTPFPMPPDRTCSGPRGPGHPSVSVSPERPSQPGRDALRLSWSPSPHRHHRLKGFQVTLLGLTGDMGRWTCWEVLLRKTQFLLTSHDLRLGVNYSITIQTLPPAGVDCPQNSHTTVHYHTRSCEEILSLEGPSLEDFCIPDWKPAQVNASVDGSTATVKFWVATPVHRVRRYNLYLGKPPDSDVPDFYAWFPRIFAMATVQGVAAQKVDAIRSKPTLFTISERPETPPAPRAATASAAPGGKREREKCAEEKRLLGKSGSGSQDEVSQLKKEIKKLNTQESVEDNAAAVKHSRQHGAQRLRSCVSPKRRPLPYEP
ncbi:unnamed protein product [Lampetra planeri]